MEKIRGVNLGNWLVLEKWMDIRLFQDVDAEDEVWMARTMEPDAMARLLKKHRDSYVTEADFAEIKRHGANLVRLPVPYFVFGDRPPFIGCIEYVDRAMDWAEQHELPILLDLHTVPGSQNGYDNGGITGVCKWCKQPEEVQFALSVLERLAKRYGHRAGLWGIQIVNEPISWLVYATAPSTGKARDKNEARGSGYVPLRFLRPFYLEAYQRLRKNMAEDKMVVFHDGFRLNRWKKFFTENRLKNILLDTHIYIFALEIYVPIHQRWIYRLFVKWNERCIRRVSKYVPVVVGEWSNANHYAVKSANDPQEQQRRFREVADMQLKAWSASAGYIYWNYQLWRDREAPMDESWKEPWALNRCWKRGWMPYRLP